MADGTSFLIRQAINKATTMASISQEINAIQNQQLRSSIPTLYIAIGGTGKDILLKLRKKFFFKYGAIRNNGDDIRNIPVKYLYYDLDQNWIRNNEGEYGQTYFEKHINFDENEKIKVYGDVKKLKDCINGDLKSRKLFSWCSTSLDSSITSGTGASRNRQFSRLAFFQNYKLIKNKIVENLGQLKNIGNDGPAVKIVLIFSLAGGTGCGSFLDLAFLCRKLIEGNPLSKIEAHIVMPNAYSSLIGKENDINFALGNGYAALKEIEYYSKMNKFKAYWDIDEEPEYISGPVFNNCYLISNTNDRDYTFNCISIFDMIADYLFYDIDSDYIFGPARRSIVNNLQNYLDDTVTSNIQFIPADTGKTFIDLNSFNCNYSTYGLSKITIPSNLIKKLCSAKAAIMMIDALKEGAGAKHNEQQQIKEAEEFSKEHFVSDFRRYKALDEANKELDKLVDEFIKNNMPEFSSSHINTNPISTDEFLKKFEEEVIKKFIVNSTKAVRTYHEAELNLPKPKEVKVINEKIISFLEPLDPETNEVGDTVYKPFGIFAARSFLAKLKDAALKCCESLDKVRKDAANFDELTNQLKNHIEDRNKKMLSVKTTIEELKKWESFKAQWEHYAFPFYGKPTIDKNIRKNKKDIEDMTKINSNEIKKLLNNLAFNKFCTSFLANYIIKEYYQEYVLLILGENEINEKIVSPYIKLDNIEKKLNEIKKESFEDKLTFYESNFSFSENEEVLNKSKEFYYKSLNESFEKPEKLRQYCIQWKNLYYDKTKNQHENDKTANKFIYEVLGNSLSDNSKQILSTSIDEICQSVINKYASSSPKIDDIYADSKNSELKSKIPELIKKSIPCLYSTHKVLFQNNIDCFRLFGTIMKKDDPNDTTLNHFKPFFNECDLHIKGLTNPPKKFDMIQRLIPYNNNYSSDTMLFFSEMHGFPLSYIQLIQEEMRNKYLELSKEERGNNSKNPLHIEINEDRFVDLVPILDHGGNQNYREIRKLELLGVLFDILKYNPQKNEYNLLYAKPGSTVVNNSIKTGVNFKESYIEHEDFLKNEINKKRLSSSGEFKLFMTYLYLEKLLQYNFPATYKSVGVQLNRSQLSSVLYSIILEEKDKQYNKIKDHEDKLKEVCKEQYNLLNELSSFDIYDQKKNEYDKRLLEVFKDILTPVKSDTYYMVKLNLNDKDLLM